MVRIAEKSWVHQENHQDAAGQVQEWYPQFSGRFGMFWFGSHLGVISNVGSVFNLVAYNWRILWDKRVWIKLARELRWHSHWTIGMITTCNYKAWCVASAVDTEIDIHIIIFRSTKNGAEFNFKWWPFPSVHSLFKKCWHVLFYGQSIIKMVFVLIEATPSDYLLNELNFWL